LDISCILKALRAPHFPLGLPLPVLNSLHKLKQISKLNCNPISDTTLCHPPIQKRTPSTPAKIIINSPISNPNPLVTPAFMSVGAPERRSCHNSRLFWGRGSGSRGIRDTRASRRDMLIIALAIDNVIWEAGRGGVDGRGICCAEGNSGRWGCEQGAVAVFWLAIVGS